jgi:hypothetical protein
VQCFSKARDCVLSYHRLITVRHKFFSNGNPFSQYHSLKKSCASRFAVKLVVVGMIRMSEPEVSVKVALPLKPSSGGSGPMKSIATGTESHCLSGMGEVVQPASRCAT